MIGFLDDSDRTGIKVCGVRTPAQGEAIVGLGVDALGVNFWPSSKRYLDPDAAQDWLPDLRYETDLVGLFVNAELDEIAEHHDNELFGIAQLHGDEGPGFCQELAAREIPFIKAIRVGGGDDIGDLAEYATSYLLLDAAQEGYGGGGVSFDWDIAAGIIGGESGRRFALAGGIRPTNVAEAIRIARPAAVDVASGVESVPGMKDLGLVRDLVSLVRRADGVV